MRLFDALETAQRVEPRVSRAKRADARAERQMMTDDL